MVGASRQGSLRPWAMHPLARAFAISIAIHLCLFSVVEMGNRMNWWTFSAARLTTEALRQLVREGNEMLAKKAQAKALDREMEETPTLFVDVDPSQAVDKAPDNTKYYAAVNTLASNPDPSRELEKPRFDGRQERVLKTADSQKPKPQTPPLQPQAKPEPAPVQPQPKEPAPKVEPQQEVKPQPKPQGAEKPVDSGDIQMAKPDVRKPGVQEPMTMAASAQPMQEPSPPTQKPATRRPRRLSEARAMAGLNPDSALQGDKMRQEGGVRRLSMQSSLNAKGSILGSYDARFVEAVQQCWDSLLRDHRYSLDRLGTVVVEFKLTQDGRITDMKVNQSDVGEIYTAICELAINKPAPYEKWPIEMRRLLGGNSREVTFTFYY